MHDYQYLTIEKQAHQSLFVLNHPLFSAKISEYGGQLLSFKPAGNKEMIWLSDSAVMDTSKAIRGGAPICWPWFGPAPKMFEGEPQHGYARIVNWQIKGVKETNSEVRLQLIPVFSEAVRKTLNLALTLEYTFSESVKVAVNTTNLGEQAFDLSLAIHTYLNVSGINNLQVPALLNHQYLDKLSNKEELQSIPFSADRAMDRIYLFDQEQLDVLDTDRKIQIKHNGHDSVVVWTPWKDGALAMSDFDDLGYLSMLCIETALTQGFSLAPNQSHTLSQELINSGS